MRSLDLQNQIATLMSSFVTQVKAHTSMGRTDINRIAETVLIPIFAEVFGYRELKNLNDSKRANYPAIDLGDDTARVAIQVTSTPSSDKIKHTLRGFVEHELYSSFDRVQIYILTEKQKSYAAKGFEKIIQGKFHFDPKQDILDYQDLLRRISTFQVDQLERIHRILEANFSDRTIAIPLEENNSSHQPQKTLYSSQSAYLNLLELNFSKRIYTANLVIDREETIERSKDTEFSLRCDAPMKRVAATALKQRGLNFSMDWLCHEGKVVTFHDLRNPDLPLAEIIDPRTICTLDSHDFYETDINYENKFKSLLGMCLQQKLHSFGVSWQHQEKMFVFIEIGNQAERKEIWNGDRRGRIVYQRTMKNNKPGEILICKHFGFRTRYLRFGQNWYLSIIPDWFFSFDGYHKSYFAKEKIDWLKQQENNKAVCNHLRFIATFLSTEKIPDLFHEHKPYPFLSFGDLVTFNNMPPLDDQAWLPPRKSTPGQMELILYP
jgi:hypothetical protein